jgi:hypothetical protein
MHDQPAARTLKPDMVVVAPAVEHAASLVVFNKRRESPEDY